MSTPEVPAGLALSRHRERFSSAWREHLDVKLDGLVVDVRKLAPSDEKDLAEHHLTRARHAVDRSVSGMRAVTGAWTGVDIERAWGCTHAAEVAILRGSSDVAATLMLPTVISECTPLLPDKDERIASLTKVLGSGAQVTASQRAVMLDVLAEAYDLSDAQHVQVRSFRNILFGAIFALTVLAVLVGVAAGLAPHAFAVCDTVGRHAASSCPTGGRGPRGGDVVLVEILGLAGAAITAAAAIRKLAGTTTPFAVPLAALLLKLPTGALTALLGILLLRAGFAPSITTLTQTQVVAYAVLFGAAQQLFLQFVDKQANVVLDAVGKAK